MTKTSPFAAVLKDLDGDPITVDSDSGESKAFTIAHGLTQVLLAAEEGQDAAQVIHRFTLARSIYAGEEVKLKAEDKVMLQRRIPKLFAPLVAAQLLEAVGD